jgi:hypothetical protein
MDMPQTGAELLQFLCAFNWIRTAVPEFAQLVSPLHHLLEDVYDKAGGKSTKGAAAQVALSDAG